MPLTVTSKAANRIAAAARRPLFRRANLQKRYAADGGQVRRVIEMSGEPVAWGVTIEPETGSETPTEPVLFVAET